MTTATILRFPSRGTAEERFLRDGEGATPNRQGVEVVGLDLPVGQKEDPFLDGRFRVSLPLFVPPHGADRAAEFVSQPLLGPSVLFAPVRQLHRHHSILPKWLYKRLASWQYANMANGQIVYIRRVANDDEAPNRIQELCDAAGITQAELARRANVSVSALNKVVKGTRGLDQEWMRRLAPHLGVAPADLLPAEDNPSILDDAERALLARYRAADAATRQQLDRVTNALVPAHRDAEQAA